ncbi:penicillin-binding protein activator LpoB [Thiohalorhabdus methylotrophus]|uniref:Penicillin-binding protein activator LpoB n=1 Tax=Thiohalorhabdus methylotrophus TaxID=3242694 RepID=A0ABV4TTP1_9GAMM
MNKEHAYKTAAGLLMAAVVATGLTACGGTQVSRVGANKQIDVTDKWNSTDSKLVAKQMIKDMVSFPWLEKWNQKHDRMPRVIIKTVRNKSHEHIPTDTFINDLKRAMLRNGQVEFVSGGAAREEVREERKEQDIYASEDTRAEMGAETGADFALAGSINSTVQQADGTRVTFYQVDLNLVDMTTTQEVWYGQKKIKKVAEKGGFF